MDGGPTSSFKSVLYRVGRPYWPSCCGGWVGMGQRGGCPQGSMLSLSAAATQIHSLSSSPQLGNSLKRSLDNYVWSSLAPESSLHFNLRHSRGPDLPDIDMRWVAFSVPYHVPVITIVINFYNSLFILVVDQNHIWQPEIQSEIVRDTLSRLSSPSPFPFSPWTLALVRLVA